VFKKRKGISTFKLRKKNYLRGLLHEQSHEGLKDIVKVAAPYFRVGEDALDVVDDEEGVGRLVTISEGLVDRTGDFLFVEADEIWSGEQRGEEKRRGDVGGKRGGKGFTFRRDKRDVWSF
jgi:hypothetical protein